MDVVEDAYVLVAGETIEAVGRMRDLDAIDGIGVAGETGIERAKRIGAHPCSRGLIKMPGCNSRMRSCEMILLSPALGLPSNQRRSILP